ncbi:hypothetical protein [Spongiimicrobium salis]
MILETGLLALCVLTFLGICALIAVQNNTRKAKQQLKKLKDGNN